MPWLGITWFHVAIMTSRIQNNRLSMSSRKRSRSVADVSPSRDLGESSSQQFSSQPSSTAAPVAAAVVAEAAATSPSRDLLNSASQSCSQPTPAQRQQEELSEVSKAIVKDELANLERDVVQVAILEEKWRKLKAMVGGSREVPREMKAERSPPSLG